MRLHMLAALAFVACYRDNDPKLPPVEPDYPAAGQLPPIAYAEGSAEAEASPCGKACANLKEIPCPEGLSKACYRACVKQASLERVPITCWTHAKTPAEARECGLVRCSR